MGYTHEHLTLLLRQVGSNQQYGRGTTQTGLEELVLVNNEILIENGNFHASTTGRLDELIAAAEILLVGKDAQGSGTVLLIAERNDVGTSLFLDPALGRGLTFELGNNACVGGSQCLRHGCYGEFEQRLHQTVNLPFTEHCLETLNLQPFVNNDFF